MHQQLSLLDAPLPVEASSEVLEVPEVPAQPDEPQQCPLLRLRVQQPTFHLIATRQRDYHLLPETVSTLPAVGDRIILEAGECDYNMPDYHAREGFELPPLEQLLASPLVATVVDRHRQSSDESVLSVNRLTLADVRAVPSTPTLRALTLYRPWAWLVALGHKRIENRPWACPLQVGDYLAIHAGKRWDESAIAFASQRGVRVLPQGQHKPGIIAVVRFEGNLTESDDSWFCGPYGWSFTLIESFPAIACAGQQRLWSVSSADQLSIEYHLNHKRNLRRKFHEEKADGFLSKASKQVGLGPSRPIVKDLTNRWSLEKDLILKLPDFKYALV